MRLSIILCAQLAVILLHNPVRKQSATLRYLTLLKNSSIQSSVETRNYRASVIQLYDQGNHYDILSEVSISWFRPGCVGCGVTS